MELAANTLAGRLGTTSHVSSLVAKARKLGLRSGADFCALAVHRGCRHYSTGDEPDDKLVSAGDFTNEELAIALLHPSLDYDPHRIRCGAAMLGTRGNDARRLARLARLERAEAVVRYVAEAGARFEPDNTFWTQLLERLPDKQIVRPGVLPHPTRFVAMTGYVRGKGLGLVVEWQRPDFQRRAA